MDAYRYYFMTDVQFGADGSISLERMVQVYNADLANTWGNLVQPRVQHDEASTSTGASAGGARRSARREENPLRAIADDLYKEYDAALGAADFTRAAARGAEAGAAA